MNCCSTGHRGHHGHHGQHSAQSCDCGCGSVHTRPHFWSKKKKIEILEQHLQELEERKKEIEEVIQELKEEK